MEGERQSHSGAREGRPVAEIIVPPGPGWRPKGVGTGPAGAPRAGGGPADKEGTQPRSGPRKLTTRVYI